MAYPLAELKAALDPNSRDRQAEVEITKAKAALADLRKADNPNDVKSRIQMV